MPFNDAMNIVLPPKNGKLAHITGNYGEYLTLYGDAGNDTLDGGVGDDELRGGAGADVYLFNKGSGQDVIYNQDDDAPGVNPDTILLGAGITQKDVTLTRSGDHLNLYINGTADKLEVRDYFCQEGVSNHGLENVKFADNTIWNLTTVRAKVLTSTADDDTLIGYSTSDTLRGGEGNDTLHGHAGNDILEGGAGEDALHGGPHNDILDGGPGNDTLSGNAGNDTYFFDKGSNDDVINNYDSTGKDNDKVVLGSGVSEDQIWLQRLGNDLQLTLFETNDKLTIQNWYSDKAYHVDGFELGNGKRLLENQVEVLVSAMAAFSPPAPGQTTLPAHYQETLNSVIAANWK